MVSTDILRMAGIDVEKYKRDVAEKEAARMEERKRIEENPSLLDPVHEEAETEYADFIAAREARMREAAISKWTNRGVPPRVAVVLASAKETEAAKAVEAWRKSSLTFIVLAGGVGCGKTVAACGAAGPEGFFFVDALELVKAGLYGEKAEAFWESAQKAKMLVLDDMGTEPRDEKGYAACAFEDLMNKRYNAMRKTILTTNLTAEAFKARYCQGSGGGRLGDRLRECGEWVALTGDSLRVKK